MKNNLLTNVTLKISFCILTKKINTPKGTLAIITSALTKLMSLNVQQSCFYSLG